MGIYPSKTMAFQDAVYVADSELSFSVRKLTTDTRGHDEDDESYSEVQWLNPSEVRLYGSLQLSFDVEKQYLSFYPHISCEPIYDGPTDLRDDDWLNNTVKQMLYEKLISPSQHEPGAEAPQLNQYRHQSDIELPTLVSDIEYDMRVDDIDYQLSSDLYNRISLNDHLYIRGIYALIKAGMLRRHHQFLEEAIYMLFIAMEVSFRLVIQALQAKGTRDPSSTEAMAYVLKAFNESGRVEEQGIEKWFEEYYDRRTMSFHPESRHGTVPHAPLYADDFGFLYRDMVEILRYLICGYVHPRHAEIDKNTRGSL